MGRAETVQGWPSRAAAHGRSDLELSEERVHQIPAPGSGSTLTERPHRWPEPRASGPPARSSLLPNSPTGRRPLLRGGTLFVAAVTGTAVRPQAPARKTPHSIRFPSPVQVHGPGLTAYSTAKAGLRGLTRPLARKGTWPTRHLREHCAPGSDPGRRRENPLGHHRAHPQDQTARSCVPRQGQPDDIATADGFSAGPAASFITGQSLHIDGGWILH